MKQLNNVTVSVGRPQGGSLNGQDEYVRIEIMDWTSRRKILQLDMELSEFAKLVTGRSDVPVGRALYDDSGAVGKLRVYEKRKVFISDDEISKAGGSWPTSNLENWLRETQQEEGWLIDPYLGSQGSQQRDSTKGGSWLNYGVYKYVDTLD